jgi:hypothetical protein
VPGGPRGLQNRRRTVLRAEERSIRSLSAILNLECRMANAEWVKEIPLPFCVRGKGVLLMSREQILKLTSLSSCAG